jgi:predicted transposase YbfD/YdcC
MNHFVREHWAIENKLHWQLDVNFGEDDARKRIGNSAKNFNLILKTALTLLQRDKINKISIKRKKLNTSYSLEYRELMMMV